MYDNNKNQEIIKFDFVEKSNTAIQFIKNLADELDMQLNSILMQQNECRNLIKEKEQERLVQEQSKSLNYDLFSPYHNKLFDTTEIDLEIKELKKRLEDLVKEQKTLQEKNRQLSNVFQCMDYISKDLNKINNNNYESIYKEKFDNGIGLLETQENERQRIARDLHDSTVQNLTSLVHKSELCFRLIDMDTVRAKLELTTMSNMIKTVINDMRDIIYNLKPMSLNDLGLILTVERYANQLMEAQDIKIVIHKNKEIKGILPVINLTLFRIIQEACSNALKHSKATIIDITINYRGHELLVSIKDNGIGFDLEMQKRKVSEHSSGYGLSIMRERISLLSGTLEILSEDGKGTIISALVPITKCEGEKNE